MTAIITTIIPTVAGIGGLIWGIYTYKETQILKRQEILFPLIKEFDESDKMYYSKAILDDVVIPPENGWEKQMGYYHISELETILRNHTTRSITDHGEAAIRESFDALLDFFAKLEYLFNIGLIKKQEISYFRYYINKCAVNK